MCLGFFERLFPQGKYDMQRMRVFALAISWISIVYNGIEGGVAIGLGADVNSRALIVFGLQSGVEVLSAALVIYRFRGEFEVNSAPNLLLEKRATVGIGVLFIILTLGTWTTTIIALVMHTEPRSTKTSLLVSASSLVCTIFVWLPKPWITAELNSSVMRGETTCSLACIYLNLVLFVGSLVYNIWQGRWWIDSAIAILLGFFFLHQGWVMISWARDKNFNGGCRKTSSAPSTDISSADNNVVASNRNNEDCCQTDTARPVVVSPVNNIATSVNWNESNHLTRSVSCTPCLLSPV